MIRKIYRLIKKTLRPPLFSENVRVDYSLLGSDYGKWPAIVSLLGAESKILSF